MAERPPVCDYEWQAPDFSLVGVDNINYSLNEISGPKGTLIMFICNHCPYVVAVLDRLVRDSKDLQDLGIGVAAISSNDVNAYPEDSFENMKKLAENRKFSFPYLFDQSQSVAHNYGAVCTPDFFGFNAKGGLQYRGRLDASKKETGPSGLKRDLYEGMALVSRTGQGPREQISSMGCSIKWKD